MTDIEKMRALLDEWDVPYESEEQRLILEVTSWSESAKIKGYSGFMTEIRFKENGDFACFGLWE